MSKTINDGGPAFPCEESTDFIVKCQCGETVTFNDVAHPGMTLRDWFAGQALAGVTANSDRMAAVADVAKMSGEESGRITARMAYEYADAMIAARGETP